MLVRAPDYAKVHKRVAGYSERQSAYAMQSVAMALDRSVPKINAGTASKKDFDDTYADLMLWHALKETMS